MTIKKSACAFAVAAMLGASSAAYSLQIDGIDFAPGALFETIDLFEGEVLGDGIGNDDGIINLPGEVLAGVGIVNRIRDADDNILWANGDNGRELVFYFYDYVAENVSNVGTATEAIDFTGGVVELYSQAAGTWGGVLTGSQAGDIAAITGGNLWLSLVGSPIGGDTNDDGTGTPFTLESFASQVGNNLNILGFGNLDVTGGAASTFFDTDTLGCEAFNGTFCPDSADVSFTSSGQINPNAVNEWVFRGTGEVQAFAVPVPGTLAMLGLGLVALGSRLGRKSAKA